MPDVEFAANGSTASGYLAVPESGSGAPVVVLQEWWGLDDNFRGICDRLAGEGFVALAPDLYHGETTEQPGEAEQKMMAMDMEEAVKEMAGAVDFVAAQDASTGSAVGAVGFCLGGGLAVWTAAANPKVTATVTYYYVMPHGKPDFAKVKGPVLGHFGTDDAWIPAEAREALALQLRGAGVETTFELYEGAGHAFANDHDRIGTYDAEAAASSWRRTVEFLRANLG